MRRARIKVAPKLGASLGSRLVKSELKPDTTPVETNSIQENTTEECTSDLSPSENAHSTLTSTEIPSIEIPTTHDDPPDLFQSNQGTKLATKPPAAVSTLQEAEHVKTPVAAVSILQESEQLKTPETEKQTAAKPILRFNKFKPKPNLARPPRKPGLAESPNLPEKVPDPIPTSVPESSTEIVAEPEIPTAPDLIQFTQENPLSDHPEAEPARLEQNKNEEVKAASTSGNASRFRPRIQRIRPNIGEGASHRVRTFSSASESEEDQGRKRVRHSSVSSRTDEHSKRPSKSQEELDDEENEARITGKNAKKVREKTALQLRKEEVMKKLKAGNLERNKLTMFDLIFYNPSSNPLPKDESQKSTRKENIDAEEIAEEEESEEIEEVTISEAGEVAKEEEDEEEQEDNAPGPRVKVGPNGEIILDEQSLVIETTEAKRNRAEMLSKPVIVETNNGFVNYGTWRKTKRSKTWTIRETARFYRALSMLGTDFSLMESLFPNRTRPELKKKFKIEEKQNRVLIDNTIRNQKQFDPSLFGPDSESDDEEIVKETAKKTRKGKENDQKKGKETKKAKKKPKGPSLERESTSQVQEQADNDPEPQAIAVAVEFKKPRVRKRPMVIQEDKEVVEECSTQHQVSPDIDSEAEFLPPVAETVEVTTHEEDECNPPSKMDLMLQSPLGQLSMEIGGVTMPDSSDTDNPSMLLPTDLTEANPSLAQAQDGSLVLVAADNPNQPGKKIIHVYKVKVGASNAQLDEPIEGSKNQT